MFYRRNIQFFILYSIAVFLIYDKESDQSGNMKYLANQISKDRIFGILIL